MALLPSSTCLADAACIWLIISRSVGQYLLLDASGILAPNLVVLNSLIWVFMSVSDFTPSETISWMWCFMLGSTLWSLPASFKRNRKKDERKTRQSRSWMTSENILIEEFWNSQSISFSNNQTSSKWVTYDNEIKQHLIQLDYVIATILGTEHAFCIRVIFSICMTR